MNAPVIGDLKEQRNDYRLTDFMEFDAATMQGLAKVDGTRIEILAVLSKQPGSGNFRQFITDLKQAYSFIRFWAMMNPELEKTLTRYGFYGGHDMDQFGEFVDVMDWTKPA